MLASGSVARDGGHSSKIRDASSVRCRDEEVLEAVLVQLGACPRACRHSRVKSTED